jgi:hypothetical protein
MPCTTPIITLLEPFRCVFTAPTWKKMLTLLRGTLLARGRRTVTTALWYTGHEQDPNFSIFHHVLNRARWSPLQASRKLLRLITETFLQDGGGVDIVIDETLERRWGSKIRKRGHYRDNALSSHERSVSSPGLRWIVLAVVVRVPWTKQQWALPFLCLLATSPQVSAQLGIRHKTLGARTRQVVSLLRRWLPGVPIKLLGDGAYSILELGLHCAHQQVTLIAPFRLDSMMHQPAPVRDPHAIGRPRVVGERLPPWSMSCRIPPRRGSGSRSTGMGKGTGPWSCVPALPAGTDLARLRCPSAGCLRAIRRESAHPKPSFPRTRRNRPKRSCGTS